MPEKILVEGFTGEVVGQGQGFVYAKMEEAFCKKFGLGPTGQGIITVYKSEETPHKVNLAPPHYCHKCGCELTLSNYGFHHVQTGRDFCTSCGEPLIEMLSRHGREETQYLNETCTRMPNSTSGNDSASCGL